MQHVPHVHTERRTAIFTTSCCKYFLVMIFVIVISISVMENVITAIILLKLNCSVSVKEAFDFDSMASGSSHIKK